MNASIRMTGAMQKFLDLLKRFHNDERGAFLALFGVLAIVLIATAGATVDFTSVQNARSRAQAALDAAALALQPRIYSTAYANEAAMELDIKNLAKALLIDRLNDTKITIVGDLIADADKVPGTLDLTVKLNAPLYFVALVGVKEMNMTINSQATKGSQDLEVSVALDVTGSMDSNGKIAALRTAANEMVDILIPDNVVQSGPTYTRMALVPWSVGVNLSSDIVAARGTPIGPKTITAAAWQSGTTDTITNKGITKATEGQVTTAAAHGLTTGDVVWISGVSNASGSSGWTALNDKKYTITVVNTTKFKLNSTNTNAASFTGSNRSNGGSVRKCLNPNCEIVVTSTAHALPNGYKVFFSGVNGMTQLNTSSAAVTAETPTLFTVSNAVINFTNTFALSGIVGPTVNYTAYTSGGTAQCVMYGCQYLSFTPQTTSPGGWGNPPTPNPRLFDVGNKCVTERVISPYQYTDTAPGTAPVGLNYPGPSNDCPDEEVVPLTMDHDLLEDTINDFEAEGSTGGQIGTAWAWYMLAPNFKSLWPTANQPADYNTPSLVKVVVLMTDGSFNTVYCNGVIAADSISGSGNTDEHIYCNATNGNPFDQAKALCDQMKSGTGIIVYTIGFDIANQSDEKDMLEYCASEPKADHYKLANDAAALSAAFKKIAQDITQLRLTE